MISSSPRPHLLLAAMPNCVALDIECAATGKGHNDLQPCWVVVVNEKLEEILNIKVRVPRLYSPMTEFTGMTKFEIENAPYSLDEAIAKVKEVIDASTTIVGQAVYNDIGWLGLVQGIDFKDSVGIEEYFKKYNRKYGNYNYHSLYNTAYGLLNISMHPNGHHSPVEDCVVSMKLFSKYDTAGKREEAATKLQLMVFRKQFPKRRQPNKDGVCNGKYNAKLCTCGQPVVPRS